MNYVLYYLLKYTIEIIMDDYIILFLLLFMFVTWPAGTAGRRKVETFFAHTGTPAHPPAQSLKCKNTV